MTIKEIIDGLKFTVDMFLFNPSTGETYTEPRNDMDKTTIDACKGAIELLDKTRWIPVSERLPEESTSVLVSCEDYYLSRMNPCIGWRNGVYWKTFTAKGCEPISYPLAWMPLPQPYNSELKGE